MDIKIDICSGKGFQGKIKLPDGSQTNFTIDDCGEFKQWGNTEENMKQTVPLMVDFSQLVLND